MLGSSPLRTVGTFSLLYLAACTGGFSCSSCGNMQPIPGGFDDTAYIQRSAQARVSATGFDFIEANFAEIVQGYAGMECGPGASIQCPSGFNGPITCDIPSRTCVDAATSTPVPVLGFELPNSTSSGATVCRDDPNDPNRRDCFIWLQLEALDLTTNGSNEVLATVTAQVLSNTIPIRYDPLNADCTLNIDSRGGSAPLPEFTLTIALQPWTSRVAGVPDGQLEVTVLDVDLSLDDEDLTIARDPVQADSPLELGCGLANIGAIKSALIPLFGGSFTDTLDDQIREMLGDPCVTGGCPNGTTCNAQFLCEDTDGKVIPMRLGVEGRVPLDDLVGQFASTPVEDTDLGFLIGGHAATDATGLGIGLLGGFEAVNINTECAQVLTAPRLDPNFQAPTPLPAEDDVDLDFDGTRETPYMFALSLGEAFVNQAIWAAYSTGAICIGLSSRDVDQLNSASLAIIVPSLNKLTHSDKYPWSVWPVELVLRAGALPYVEVGAGEVRADGTVVDPLLNVHLPSVTIDLMTIVEERWVHVLTISADLTIPFGAFVNPANQVELVLGELSNAFTNVRVSNNRILGESAAQIESALPGLLSVFLPEITGSFIDPIDLPDASSLGGFELNVLGIRGVEDGAGGHEHAAVYADLGFDASQALTYSVDTHARILSVELPQSEAMSVTHVGGLQIPRVSLGLDAKTPDGRRLEHQIRIDGGLWGTFFQGAEKHLARHELLFQGRHKLEVRSRVVGEYRSLDPTPVELEVVIDTEPPWIDAELRAREGGARIRAGDHVSDSVRIELAVDGVWREIRPDANDFVVIPEVSIADAELRVAAIDDQGHRTEHVLRQRRVPLASGSGTETSAEASGCLCVRSGGARSAWPLLGLLLVAFVRRRR